MTRKNAVYLTFFCFLFLFLGIRYINSDTVLKQLEQEVVATNKYGVYKGDIATNFQLINQKGERVSLSDYRGKKVVLNFFATWCAPCQEEMPILVNLHNKRKDITVLGVNVTTQEQNPNQVEQFIKHFEVSYNILYDGKGDVLEDYELIGIPTTLLLDEKGTIVERINGMITYEYINKHSFFQ